MTAPRARTTRLHGAALLGTALLLAACNGGSGPDAPAEPPADPAAAEPAGAAATAEAAEAPAAAASAGEPALVEEAFLTVREEAENVDSVATWHGDDGQHWLIATAKEGNVLQVFDAATGEPLQRVGETGDGPGQFSRPNGISVVDDMVAVVERNNTRVQLFSLPGFEPLGSFGSEQLRRPYGIWLQRMTDGAYRAFITDAYEAAEEQLPPEAELGERIKQFRFTVGEDGVSARHERSFGATEGDGVLHKVESLFGDPETGRLLVADEDAVDIKLYDFGGRFEGTVLGAEIFEYEPEGIALYACADGSGYWFTTDQDTRINRFHVFKREALDYVGSFGGPVTRNTDGVWLTQTAMPGFPAGTFYAVHDDGNVAAFDLSRVFDALSLTACSSEGN